MRASPERLNWVMMVMNVHYKIAHTYFKARLSCFVSNHTNQADSFFQPLILKKIELYNTNKKGGRSPLLFYFNYQAIKRSDMMPFLT